MARSRSCDASALGPRLGPAHGFTLVETLVAVALMTTIAAGVAQLFAVAITANARSQGSTSTSILAAQKLEQLRALTWAFGDQTTFGRPLTDTTTNLATDPPGDDGRGLDPSPPGTLHTSTPGYVDYLDASGRWVGTGATPPPGTVFVRRWSIHPLPSHPASTIVLQVRVVTLVAEQRSTSSPSTVSSGLGDEAWLVSVKTRKSP